MTEPDTDGDVGPPPHDVQTIARQNDDNEVTIHIQGTVTEWITSPDAVPLKEVR